MKRRFLVVLTSVFLVLFFVYACPPASKSTMTFKVPDGWPAPFYSFEKGNKLTDAGFQLGKKLFYDRRLSRDNTISCGSCHQQFAAFAHLDHATSHGIENKLGKRNTPPLFNLSWNTSFFWDGGVKHIEVQPISPMQNPVEMDESLEKVVNKINSDTSYRSLFKKAYGDETVNSQRLLKALAQFMGSMVSCNSKYDRYMRKEVGAVMTESELNGLALFREKCSSCHKEPLFTDYSFRNNGLTPRYGINDSGRATITRQQTDMYKFRVPTLRNLKYTWPYMHDGRFSELEEVINHYAGAKFDYPTLDAAVKTRLYLTVQQQTDLLAFLNTLNDETFVNNKLFRDDNAYTEIKESHSHNFRIR